MCGRLDHLGLDVLIVVSPYVNTFLTTSPGLVATMLRPFAPGTHSDMSAPASPHRLRVHPSPDTARNSIISSSAKGWSPLQVNKRDSVTSPLKPSPNPSDHDGASPRRTSSSFKHVSKHSLVSNSPFLSPATVQGQQAAGMSISKDQVIHESRSARSLEQAAEAATGAAATSKAAIGLGISASRPKSRTPSGGASVSGTRKVSNERAKVAFPSVTGERRTSEERKVSVSKENDSPDVRYTKRTPKSSMGLTGLAKGELVSKSPFKRVPSGGLSPSTRANESPSVYSPKTIPVERDDVFSSPSPRRTSGGKRRVSPGTVRPSARTSDSSTSSPPISLAQTATFAGPSPLSQPLLAPPDDPTPTPTPAKSSMTPSRRLRGPRDLTDTTDSPTKAKTVTFQSIPDVKEFERLSTEGSADGSFELEEEWVDNADGRDEDTSLDDILDESALDRMAKLRVTNPDDHDESMTADFVNTLIEEGLFSPPQIATPAFDAQPAFDMEDKPAPFLSTPSLGDSVHATPLFGCVDTMGDIDSAGIPYRRTHHAERAALTHSLPQLNRVSPLERRDMPHASDHQMFMNGNAAQPSLPHSYPAPLAHQDGPMPDPFITIQTATKALSPECSRSEGGIPLGRTSHVGRVQAARTLATQSLGLGMPRSPAISKDLTSAQASPEMENEMLFDASFEESPEGQAEVETPLEKEDLSRRLPKPPQPRQLDLPSPVSSPVKEAEKPEPKKVSLSLGSRSALMTPSQACSSSPSPPSASPRHSSRQPLRCMTPAARPTITSLNDRSLRSRPMLRRQLRMVTAHIGSRHSSLRRSACTRSARRRSRRDRCLRWLLRLR